MPTPNYKTTALKDKNLMRLLFIFLTAIYITACGGSKNTESDNIIPDEIDTQLDLNNAFNGDWVGCINTDGWGSYLIESTVLDGIWQDETTYYENDGCQYHNPHSEDTSTQTGSYSLGNKITLANNLEAYEVDWVIENSDNTTENCYSILSLQGNIQLWGTQDSDDDCSSPETRHTIIDNTFFIARRDYIDYELTAESLNGSWISCIKNDSSTSTGAKLTFENGNWESYSNDYASTDCLDGTEIDINSISGTYTIGDKIKLESGEWVLEADLNYNNGNSCFALVTVQGSTLLISDETDQYDCSSPALRHKVLNTEKIYFRN